MQELKIINPKKELTHILNYLDKTWDGVNEEAVKSLWDKAIKDTKNELDFYGFNHLIDYVSGFQDEYEKSGKKIKSLEQQININSLISTILPAYDKLCAFEKENRTWSADEFTTYISSTKPKDWEPLYTTYQTRDDIEKYMKGKSSNKLKFLGTNFEHEETFQYLVSMKNVMYFAKEQETPPEELLSYALLKHARCVNKQNNQIKMSNDWIEAIRKLASSDFNLSFKEPLNIALQHLMKDENPSDEVYSAFDLKKPKNRAKP